MRILCIPIRGEKYLCTRHCTRHFPKKATAGLMPVNCASSPSRCWKWIVPRGQKSLYQRWEFCALSCAWSVCTRTHTKFSNVSSTGEKALSPQTKDRHTLAFSFCFFRFEYGFEQGCQVIFVRFGQSRFQIWPIWPPNKSKGVGCWTCKISTFYAVFITKFYGKLRKFPTNVIFESEKNWDLGAYF